jgi:glycine cleavage system aminomethyltransferase T
VPEYLHQIRDEELGLFSHSEIGFTYNLFIGVITSGIPSPTLGKNVAMGYIKSGWHKKGTEVAVEVRKQLRKASITPLAFCKGELLEGLRT